MVHLFVIAVGRICFVKENNMNKVRIFHEEYYWTLEQKINDFAQKHTILNVSIATEKHGYSTYYTAAAIYEV